MSVEASKKLVRRYYEGLFQDLETALEAIADDYVDHNNEQAGRGPEVLRAHVAGLLTTFPDFGLRVEDMIAEGDRVVTRVTGEGTHAGVWRDIQPTGSLVRVRGVNIESRFKRADCRTLGRRRYGWYVAPDGNKSICKPLRLNDCNKVGSRQR